MLAFSVFLVVVDNTIVNVALPTLSRDLNASTTDLQWIVDAYSLVFAGLLLAAGGLGDRIGRKGTMQVGLLIFAATSVVAAFSTSSGQLIASRAAMGIGAALVFPTSRDPDSGAFDWVGTVVSILGIGLLVYTVIEGPHAGWNSLTTIGGFIGAAILLFVFVPYELRREHPLLDVRVFRIARFSAAAGSIAVAFFTLFGFIFIVTQYFQFVRGYSTLSAGLHTLPFAIFAAITAPNAARLALRFGPRRVVGTGLLTMMVGFIIIGFCDADTVYFGPVVISMAFIATGLSLVTSPSTAAVMSSLPKEKAGAGAAVNDTTREIGGTLGVAVVGSVFASIYAPKIGEFLAKFPQAPAEAVTAAKASMAAAIMAASQAPTEVQELFRTSASDAFMQGMRLGCFVCAGVALCGSIAAFTFLPDLESEEAPHPGEWSDLEQSRARLSSIRETARMLTTDDLIARAEITDVIQRLARGTDRLDRELMASCYHSDGFDDHNSFRGSGVEFADWVCTVLPHFAATTHFIALPHIRLDGDVAQVDTYCVAHHVSRADQSGQATDMVMALRYVDRFERRAGQWLIAKRVCAFDWNYTVAFDPAGTFQWEEDFAVGARDRTDLTYGGV